MRHSGEGRNPYKLSASAAGYQWIPASAGMTDKKPDFTLNRTFPFSDSK